MSYRTNPQKMGCKIHNNLPWHSQKDIASFFGKTIKTINEHCISSTPEDTMYLICEQTEGIRLITRSIKHYSFNYVAGLCYRMKSITHTQRYKAFLNELGIIWPDRVPIPCDEKNFTEYLVEIFDGVVHIHPQYPVGEYQVDGYIESLNLVFELDGHGHDSPQQKQNDVEREKYIKKALGAEIIRAPLGNFTLIANTIILRLLDKK